MVTGMMPLYLCGFFFKEISLLQCYVAAHSPWYKKNESSLCMNNCLSESQLYDTEYLFCISRPNKISVSGSLSHMMKVLENSNLAMGSCKVALPREDIDDP